MAELGTKLVISDAHLGPTAAIKRMFQGCFWQLCWVHFLRNLLSQVTKAGQDMVAALYTQSAGGHRRCS